MRTLTLEQWCNLHNDALHPSTRETCEHCQLMIQTYGPMPSVEEMRRYMKVVSTPVGNKYSKRPIPEAIRWEVWDRDNFACNNCGTRRYLTIDHITPESKGGPTTLANLQTLCRSCNSKKGTTHD